MRIAMCVEPPLTLSGIHATRIHDLPDSDQIVKSELDPDQQSDSGSSTVALIFALMMLAACSKHILGQCQSLFGRTQKQQPPEPEAKNVSDESLPEPAPPFTIAIIGAGIGGLTLAIGCLKQNVSFVLYEAAAQYSIIGAGVGIGPNAVRAMYMIDPKLRDMYYATSSGNLTPGKEHVMMEATHAEEDFGQKRGCTPLPFGAECYQRTSAHRRDLLNHLTSMIPRHQVRFSKRVVDVQQLPNSVIIRFEDGETVEHTAVIGADGIKGPLRRHVLGKDFPQEVAPTYTGRYVYRFTLPIKEAQNILGSLADDAKCFMGDGINLMAYPISKGTEYNIVAVVCKETPWTHDKWTRKVSKEEMVADFKGKVDERIIKMLDWAEPVQWSVHHHINTPIYYNRRICLLGDSAHATTPHQAAGAGQGIEDALIMSHVLGKVRSPKQLTVAFAIFDSIRRPRAQRVVETSYECGSIYSFSHPDFEDDIGRIATNLNRRFLWIWEHNLEVDLKKADVMFEMLTTGI